MKSWWETIFGNTKSPLRALIQEHIFNLLDPVDNECYCSLFRLICQLCYTKICHATTGVEITYLQTNEIKLPKKQTIIKSTPFACFVRYLGPFEVEHLRNDYEMFLDHDQDPLLVIIENSPLLKSIYLQFNASSEVIKHIAKFCPKLERFVIDSIRKYSLKPENLYEAFFRGKSEEQLRNGNCDLDDIGFPNLLELDIGKSRYWHLEFLFHVNLYYPNIKNVTCNSSYLKPSFVIDSYDSKIFKPFQIVDACINSNFFFMFKEINFFHVFPNVKTITLLLHTFYIKHISVLKVKVAKFFANCTHGVSIVLPCEISDNRVLNDILIPLLTEIGSNVKALQLYIYFSIEVRFIYKLINLCPNLELLSLKFYCERIQYEHFLGNEHLLPLRKLKSFSYFVTHIHKCTSEFDPYMQLLEDILQKVACLLNFELTVFNIVRERLLNIIKKDYITSVETLKLNFDLFSDIDGEFYTDFIEPMTSLRKLTVIGLPPSLLSYLRRVFKYTQLCFVNERPRSCIYSRYDRRRLIGPYYVR